MKLPNERLITKSELIIVKQTVHECIWTLFINWQYNKQPVIKRNITDIKGVSIDVIKKISEYILDLWYGGISFS